MRKIILILFILPLLSFISIHKFYVALTDINFNQKEQAVQMIMNVFIDDIELAINEEFKIDAQIQNKNQIKNLDNYYIQYLKKHFKININNQDKEYNFIGKEYDGDIVFFYLEIKNIPEVNSIKISNSVLTKQFSEQQNLIKIKVKNKRKSLFLNKENNKGLLNF